MRAWLPQEAALAHPSVKAAVSYRSTVVTKYRHSSSMFSRLGLADCTQEECGIEPISATAPWFVLAFQTYWDSLEKAMMPPCRQARLVYLYRQLSGRRR